MKNFVIFVAFITAMIATTQAQNGVIMTMHAFPTEYALTLEVNDDPLSPTFGELYIKVDGSENNVSYQLFVTEGIYDQETEDEARIRVGKKAEKGNFKPVGDPIEGTGKAILFPLPENRWNITCMVKATNPCGEFEMKNWITTKDIEEACENFRMESKSQSDDGSFVSDEEAGFDPLVLIPSGILILVAISLIYGITKRKNLSFGEHKEIKAPLTGHIRKKK